MTYKIPTNLSHRQQCTGLEARMGSQRHLHQLQASDVHRGSGSWNKVQKNYVEYRREHFTFTVPLTIKTFITTTPDQYHVFIYS